jgi:hypothetical protein
MIELERILNIINKTQNYVDYVEYKLSRPIYIDNVVIKNIVNELNNHSNIECYYNGKSRKCDIVGVVDMNNIRIIDLDDNIYSLTNKGIDQQIKDVIH